MARVFAKASTQSIYSAFSSITGVPLTMACWGKPVGFSTHMATMDIGQGSTGGQRFRLHYVQTSGAVRCLAYPGSGAGFATTTTNATAGQWSHMCGVFASDTDRRVFLNGGSKGTNTTFVSVAATNYLYIGRGNWSSSPSYFPFDGSLVWPAIWNVALSDDEVASLASGINPLLIRPGNLKFFAPLGGLDGDYDNDIVGGLSLTPANSPTWSDQSPAGLIYPSQQIIGVPQGISGPIYNQRQILIRNQRLILK